MLPLRPVLLEPVSALTLTEPLTSILMWSDLTADAWATAWVMTSWGSLMGDGVGVAELPPQPLAMTTTAVAINARADLGRRIT